MSEHDWSGTLDGMDPEELRSLAAAATERAKWLEEISAKEAAKEALRDKVQAVLDELSDAERSESRVYWQERTALILAAGEKGVRKQQVIIVYANGLGPSSAKVGKWADGVRDTRV